MVVANFNLTTASKTVNFAKKGLWTNLISNTGSGTLSTGLNGVSGSAFTITSTSQSITLQPGEYHIYYSPSVSGVPLNLLSFTGQNCQDNVCLNWVTANEVNVENMIVEKSADGKTFQPLATVNADGGNGNNYYNYEDKQPFAGFNFYRLKIIDKDGSFTYSQIVKVDFMNVGVEVSPNPAKDFITVHANIGMSSIELINAQGVQLKKYNLNGINSSKLIPTNDLAAGLYIIRIGTPTGFVTKQVVIVR